MKWVYTSWRLWMNTPFFWSPTEVQSWIYTLLTLSLLLTDTHIKHCIRAQRRPNTDCQWSRSTHISHFSILWFLPVGESCWQGGELNQSWANNKSRISFYVTVMNFRVFEFWIHVCLNLVQVRMCVLWTSMSTSWTSQQRRSWWTPATASGSDGLFGPNHSSLKTNSVYRCTIIRWAEHTHT